jgi:hypothetical protein
MITIDQLRLLVSLLSTPTTTIPDLCSIYYGAKKEDGEITMQITHMRRHLKNLMLKLDYWGLPHIITISKDGSVKLTEREATDEKAS